MVELFMRFKLHLNIGHSFLSTRFRHLQYLKQQTSFSNPSRRNVHNIVSLGSTQRPIWVNIIIILFFLAISQFFFWDFKRVFLVIFLPVVTDLQMEIKLSGLSCIQWLWMKSKWLSSFLFNIVISEYFF